MKKVFFLLVTAIMIVSSADVWAGFYLNVVDKNGSFLNQVSADAVRNWYFRNDSTVVFTTDAGNEITFSGVDYVRPARTISEPGASLGWDLDRTLLYGGGSYGIEFLNNSTFFEVLAVVHEKGVAFYSFRHEQEMYYANHEIASRIFQPSELFSGCPSLLTLFISGQLWASMSRFHHNGMFFNEIFSSESLLYGYNKDFWKFNGESNAIPTAIEQNPDGSIFMSFTNYKGEYKEHTFREWGGAAAASRSLVLKSGEPEEELYIAVTASDGKAQAKFSFSDTEGIRCRNGEIIIAKASGKIFTYAQADIAPFEFVSAPKGSGTGNALISAPAKDWYHNGTLHVAETGGEISVYSLDGRLVKKFSADRPEIYLPLPRGMYIAVHRSYSFKFVVQ